MRKKVSVSKLGCRNHFFGLIGQKNPANRPDVLTKIKAYQNRPDIKEKHRRVYVEMMSRKRYTGGQFFNANACKFIDSWGLDNGFKFEHAMNGKELQVASYWVDGYDSDRNVIFEYDESHHYKKRGRGNLRDSDVRRMKTIQSELKCDFIRYNETTNEISVYPYDNQI